MDSLLFSLPTELISAIAELGPDTCWKIWLFDMQFRRDFKPRQWRHLFIEYGEDMLTDCCLFDDDIMVDCVTTLMFGHAQSIDDAPAEVVIIDTDSRATRITFSVWYDLGVVHRVGGPAVVSNGDHPMLLEIYIREYNTCRSVEHLVSAVAEYGGQLWVQHGVIADHGPAVIMGEHTYVLCDGKLILV